MKNIFINFFKKIFSNHFIRFKLNFFAFLIVTPMIFIVFFLFSLLIYTINKNLNSEITHKQILVSKNLDELNLKIKTFLNISSKDLQLLKGTELGKVTLVGTHLSLFTKEMNLSFSAVHDMDGFLLGKNFNSKVFFEDESFELYFQEAVKLKSITPPSLKNTKDGLVYLASYPLSSSFDSQKITGILSGGFLVDDNFASLLKKNIIGDVFFIKDNKLIASSFDTNMSFDFSRLEGKTNIKLNNRYYFIKPLDFKQRFSSFSAFVIFDITKEKQLIINTLIFNILFLLISFFIIIKTIKYISSVIVEPINELVLVSSKIAENNYNIRAVINTNDEFKILGDNFNLMLDKVLNLNQSLENKVIERTTELENSLSDLKNAQKQLVESEKLASLGGLVAGISHEVNTPIGVCLTGISFLKEKILHLKESYESDNMSQEEFESFLNIALESTDIIIINITRADELIKSFKQIAVDQASEAKRIFNIKKYIEQIFNSLKPKLKRTKHNVMLKCEDDIEIEGYPGLFSQIITNLILNSLVHGFEDIEEGVISIEVLIEDMGIILIYEDNGKGISKEYISKIYDPFFTTKRGQGGSGLGMYLVYSIVTQKLKGTIKLESEIGKGVKFTMEIPFSDN